MVEFGTMIPVLDRGWVELQDMMPHPSTLVHPDTAIASAARASYNGETKGELADGKLVARLLRDHHTTPFEMVEFKFRIYAPLVVWWQWVRHRSWSYNLQSGRYTPFEEDDFYMPEEWRQQSASNKQGSDGVLDPEISKLLTKQLEETYQNGYQYYANALNMGVAREQARLFLPGFSVYYKGILKVDGKNLLDFIRLRTASDAQYEIREYANVIYDNFVKPAMPATCAAFEKYILGNDDE